MPKPIEIKYKGIKVDDLKKVDDEKAIDESRKLVELKETNSTVPTYIPKNFLDQMYLYKNGTDYRLYLYLNNEWKYIDLT